jgi:hypothetical protein
MRIDNNAIGAVATNMYTNNTSDVKHSAVKAPHITIIITTFNMIINSLTLNLFIILNFKMTERSLV